MYMCMSVRVYLSLSIPRPKCGLMQASGALSTFCESSFYARKIIEGHSVGEGQKTRNRVHVLIFVSSCSFTGMLRKSRTICPCCHSAGLAVWLSTSADIPSMKSGWIAAVSKRPGSQIAPLFARALGCRAFLMWVCHHQTHQQDSTGTFHEV